VYGLHLATEAANRIQHQQIGLSRAAILDAEAASDAGALVLWHAGDKGINLSGLADPGLANREH